MAKQTRGNALLNAYMNRYMNEQASAVNSGEKNIASAASQGAQQISAVPTNLPELTDFSDSVYSSILNRDKEQRAAYEQAVKEAQEAAEQAAKSAAAKTSTQKSSGGSSSSGASSASSEDSTKNSVAMLSEKKDTSAQEEKAKSSQKVISKNKAPTAKNQSSEKKTETATKKSVSEVAKELDEKQQAAKSAQQASTQYAAAGNRATTTQSTDVGLASSYGAYAQSRAAKSAEEDRKALAEKKAEETAKAEAEKKTTLANLRADSNYMHQLAQPGVKLTDNQMDAVREYLDDLDGDTNFTKRIWAQMELGRISAQDATTVTQDYSQLKQKVSLGGLGQDLQAFTAGIYNSVPFLETIDDAFTDWANQETGGKYSEAVPQSMTDTLQGYEQQNPVAGMAGRFAGNAALYGAANAALEGTAFANAAASVGGKTANALKSVPGVGNLVTNGTGAAIGNIITGQTADLALDTIPSLAGDVYNYANGNPDNLTPGQIAANTAGNFGVNLAMNVGSEAIPALWRAGKNAVTNAQAARAAADTEAAKNMVQAYENDLNGAVSSFGADAASKDLYTIPALDVEGNVSVNDFVPESYKVQSQPEITSLSAYDLTPQNTPSARAQELTGRGRQSQYTRQIENIFDRVANGESADAVAEEAAAIAQAVYKPADFTTTVEVDPAIKELRDYVRNTPIKLGQQEAGDLLSSTGYKSISAYNKANGTKFSLNNGVDWDSAVKELSGMNVGMAGDTFDDLLQAVDRSAVRAEKNFDEDLYNTYVDYVRDSIVAGPNNAESFEDWIETQGFDYNNLPDYQQRAYDRWQDGTLDLPQTAKEGLPEYGIGAKKSDFDRSVVPNRDYGSQRRAREGLDKEHADQVGYSTHQVWTDAEAKNQAENDIETAIQLASGDVDAGLRSVMDDLRKYKTFDNGQMATAEAVRSRLKELYGKTEAGTPEFYQRAAEYNDWVDFVTNTRGEAARVLRQGQNTKMTAETGMQKMRQVTNEIGEKWAEGNKTQSDRIRQLSEELDKLRKELDARNMADMEEEAMRGAFGEQANTPAGNMNEEFDAFLKEQGVKTDPTEQFNDLVASVKQLGEKYKVEISDETAKSIAGKIQAGSSTESYYNKLLNEAAGITDLSLEEMEEIDNLYSRAAELPDSKERYDLEQQALQIMAQHLPAKTWFERFDNFRYLAMLGNTRTHVRNLLGNVAMSAVTKAKDEVAAAYQLALPQSQRTKSLYTPKEMKDAARQYLNEQAYSTIRGGSKYNLAQGLEAARRTYGESLGGRVLQKLSDLNSTALEKEDQFFLESAFVRSLSSNLSAKGFDTSIFSATDEVSQAVLKNAVDQAVQDAKEATFRADGLLSSILGTVGTIGKDGNVITQAAEKALARNGKRLSGTSKKIAYIISSGLLPFSKTPANILKTSLEYNPVGGVVEAVSRGARGEGAAAVTDALAKGTVGTGIIGLGWWLADSGLVLGSSDEETGEYDETLGRQNYSLVIPGQGSYTIDWASPAAVPFLIGANLAQEGVNLEDIFQNRDKFASEFADILMKSLDPVTEMSLLSSFEKIYDSIRYSNENELLGIGADLATSYAQQFIPTVFGQVARSIDPARRNTYGGGDTSTERDQNYLLRSTQNKIPVFSTGSEPYIDQWGRAEASLDGTGFDAAGIAGRLAYNMISPGYFAAENVTPVDSYIQELYGQTGDSGVIPELAPSYVTVDGAKQYLTPEEKTEYATTSGQLSYSLLDELSDNSVFTSLPENQQADIVKEVYNLSNKVGAYSAIPSLDYSNDDAFTVYQNAGEQGAVNFLLSKSAYSSALADKKASSGNENAQLTESERWLAIADMGLDEASAVDVYLMQADSDSKAQQVYDSYGSSATADWLEYKANYDYAYQKAKENVAGTDEKVSQQSIAESVLNQLGYDNETKRLFWQMTGSNWAERNNPF